VVETDLGLLIERPSAGYVASALAPMVSERSHAARIARAHRASDLATAAPDPV
jgi:hypothetical protein